MNKNKLIEALERGDYSVAELTEILYAVRRARRAAVKRHGVDLLPGDAVHFVRGGKQAQGKIEKMNCATAVVTCGTESLKIPLISLKKVSS